MTFELPTWLLSSTATTIIGFIVGYIISKTIQNKKNYKSFLTSPDKQNYANTPQTNQPNPTHLWNKIGNQIESLLGKETEQIVATSVTKSLSEIKDNFIIANLIKMSVSTQTGKEAKTILSQYNNNTGNQKVVPVFVVTDKESTTNQITDMIMNAISPR